MKPNCPTEEQEQRLLLAWAARTGRPELRLLHAIPNGGKRLKSEAARLQAMGVKPGVPDLCLPVPRGKYHGLYIELKRLYGGRVSPAQRPGWRRCPPRATRPSCARARPKRPS